MTMSEGGTLLDTPIRLTWGYYRQPNGWITVSPATDLEELVYRKGGWVPLTQYGRVEMLTAYAANHPLEALFLRGGAHELPLEQIIQTGMYMNLPLLPVCRQPLNQYHKGHKETCWSGAQPVHFPQLEGVVIPGPFTCEFCGTLKPTKQARDQHQTVAHKEEQGDIRTGETLAAALAKGLQERSEAPSGAMGALLEELLRLRAEVEAMKAEGGRRSARKSDG